MDAELEDAIRRIEENDSELSELRLHYYDHEPVGFGAVINEDEDDEEFGKVTFYFSADCSPGANFFARLGDAVGSNTHLELLDLDGLQGAVTGVADNAAFLNGIKRNSSIKWLMLSRVDLSTGVKAMKGEKLGLDCDALYSSRVMIPFAVAFTKYLKLFTIFGKSRLRHLELDVGDIDVDALDMIANVVAKSKSLMGFDLRVPGGRMAHSSEVAQFWRSFCQSLCDTSTINGTYFSNHTLSYVSFFGSFTLPPIGVTEIVDVNCHIRNKKHRAMLKVLRYHPNWDMTPLFEWELKIDNTKLAAIYQFIRGMPEVFELVGPDPPKCPAQADKEEGVTMGRKQQRSQKSKGGAEDERPELRFKALPGHEPGTRYPYQVRLDDGRLIYASADTDGCITSSDVPEPAADNDPLFALPPPREECPICFIPLPLQMTRQTQYFTCCGKVICAGCVVAGEDAGSKEKCPFCRSSPPYSESEGLRRLRDRVDKNDPEAMVSLGVAYNKGLMGLKKDKTKSIEYTQLAAILGLCTAHFNMGCAYLSGYDGLEFDESKARYHLGIAAMAGHGVARERLGLMDIDLGKDHYLTAFRHFMVGAKSGYARCLELVKEGYQTGNVTKDEFAACLRANKAALDKIKSPSRDKALILHPWTPTEEGGDW
ncbi:hypothetical protein ACHAXT_005484 [Thalassiosira profunda]